MFLRFRRIIIVLFALLALASAYALTRIEFGFDFEHFFPKGDDDLTFFEDFIETFETDDNFLFVAVVNDEGVFQSDFLERFHTCAVESRSLPYVLRSHSLTQLRLPVKTPFGFTSLPVIHVNEPARYHSDRIRIMNDERFVHKLIAPDGRSMAIIMKTIDHIRLRESSTLIQALRSHLDAYDFDDYHILGIPNMQEEIVRMEKRELLVAFLGAGVLICLLMTLIFRRLLGTIIGVGSIVLGLLLFLGLLSTWGQELSVMAAFYPILMLIVGASDVIHIMSKYVDELKQGHDRQTALRLTFRQIGVATLLTSVTTAVGFLSLATSDVLAIERFGINAAIGVLVAYATVILFTLSVLSYFPAERIVQRSGSAWRWEEWMQQINDFTRKHPRRITGVFLVALVLCLLGISQITTNYRIQSNLPRGTQLKTDFLFFEKHYAGFRPYEVAIRSRDGYNVEDLEVLQAMDAIEKWLRSTEVFKDVTSLTSIYKTANQVLHGNQQSAYVLPESERALQRQKKLIERMPFDQHLALKSADGRQARISCRILDIGADRIEALNQDFDRWIAAHIDSSVVDVRRTGTGLLLDKNARYIRNNLLQGLGLALVIVSILMAFLFRSIKMLLISLMPNLFPLLFVAAVLGYAGLELETGISIVFAIAFGICVDDTIHFLSRFKLLRSAGASIEEALHGTFRESAKAICYTTIVLFFGFLVLLFSIYPPSYIVGLLISITLFAALFSDLLLLPVLIRWAYGSDRHDRERQ